MRLVFPFLPIYYCVRVYVFIECYACTVCYTRDTLNTSQDYWGGMDGHSRTRMPRASLPDLRSNRTENAVSPTTLIEAVNVPEPVRHGSAKRCRVRSLRYDHRPRELNASSAPSILNSPKLSAGMTYGRPTSRISDRPNR